MLLSKEEVEASTIIRKLIGSQATNSMQAIETVEKIFNMFAKTTTNKEFMTLLKSQVVKKSKDKE